LTLKAGVLVKVLEFKWQARLSQLSLSKARLVAGEYERENTKEQEVESECPKIEVEP